MNVFRRGRRVVLPAIMCVSALAGLVACASTGYPYEPLSRVSCSDGSPVTDGPSCWIAEGDVGPADHQVQRGIMEWSTGYGTSDPRLDIGGCDGMGNFSHPTVTACDIPVADGDPGNVVGVVHVSWQPAGSPEYMYWLVPTDVGNARGGARGADFGAE